MLLPFQLHETNTLAHVLLKLKAESLMLCAFLCGGVGGSYEERVRSCCGKD